MAIRLKAKAIVVRHDTTARWAMHPLYRPEAGEIMVYTDKKRVIDDQGNEVLIPGIKIGDGRAYGIDLPFVSDYDSEEIMARLKAHEENTDIHTNPEEKAFWSQKLNLRINGETLVFNRE